MKTPHLFTVICMLLLLISGRAAAQCCNFTYQQQVEPPGSAATFGVALADFDNDGDKDAVAVSAYSGIDVYFNNGSGTFTLNNYYAVGTDDDYYGVFAVNVDSDSDIDIIAIPYYTTTDLTILINNGAGQFTPNWISSSISSYNAAVGDIDSDGDVDIFLPNAGGGAGKVFKNMGAGNFTLFQNVSGGRGHDADLADLDGDGDMDAFVVENSTYGNSVFLNNGSGTFTQYGITFGTNGNVVALGDLDGDGDKDAWVGTFGSTAEIYTNNGSGTFTLAATLNVGSYCKAVNLYDIDNDGDLDAFLGFYSSNPQVWKNNGTLNFSLCYQAPVGSSSHGQAIGFINNDSQIDIYSGYFSNSDGDYVFLNAGMISASINYEDPYCIDDPGPEHVMQTGATGGTYAASPSGLSINSANGDIIPSSSAPGNYTVTYTVSGCAFNTTVSIVSVNAATTLNDPVITAVQAGASYQWLDCNNAYAPVAGQTGQSFTAPANGSYAVIVTYFGCKDTSACVSIYSVGLPSAGGAGRMQVFPNPASGRIRIVGDGTYGTPVRLQVYDMPGKLQIDECGVTELDISALESGVYYLVMTSDRQGIQRAVIIRE